MRFEYAPIHLLVAIRFLGMAGFTAHSAFSVQLVRIHRVRSVMNTDTDKNKASAGAESAKVWYHVFAFPSMQYIGCDVSGDAENPDIYDPRIGGNGDVIWQKADVNQ